MKKTAVILFNLGGPDKLESVEPFLFNLFNDKAIIGLPQPFRKMLARFISGKRGPKAAGIYEQMGGRSPIRELTEAQAEALQKKLGDGYKVFICMRYWHPMAEEVAANVKEYAPDEIILLPLYPQFSTTTSRSSIRNFLDNYKLPTPVKTICCYPDEKSFIASHVALLKESVEKHPNARVLFSAHGLPEKVIKAGDPYAWQVKKSSEAIANQLGLKDWRICYQSKVGPLPWLKPNTVDEIKTAGTDGVDVILIPIAFVSEHSETLVELDIEFAHIAQECGIKNYIRIPALGIQDEFINSLANICQPGYQCGRICPAEFSQCPQKAA